MTNEYIKEAARKFFTDKAQFGEPSPAFLDDVVEFVQQLQMEPSSVDARDAMPIDPARR